MDRNKLLLGGLDVGFFSEAAAVSISILCQVPGDSSAWRLAAKTVHLTGRGRAAQCSAAQRSVMHLSTLVESRCRTAAMPTVCNHSLAAAWTGCRRRNLMYTLLSSDRRDSVDARMTPQDGIDKVRRSGAGMVTRPLRPW